jgi:hypothetical protein
MSFSAAVLAVPRLGSLARVARGILTVCEVEELSSRGEHLRWQLRQRARASQNWLRGARAPLRGGSI